MTSISIAGEMELAINSAIVDLSEKLRDLLRGQEVRFISDDYNTRTPRQGVVRDLQFDTVRRVCFIMFVDGNTYEVYSTHDIEVL